MKRVVFIHPDGLHQILGVLGTADAPVALPVTVEGFTVLGRLVPFASLVKVKRGAAYYKEPMLPTSAQSFHEAQQ